MKLGLSLDQLEHLGFIEYQHANLDLSEAKEFHDSIELQEIAHESVIRAAAKMIEANNSELLKQLLAFGIPKGQ
jgi:hypothetical protein